MRGSTKAIRVRRPPLPTIRLHKPAVLRCVEVTDRSTAPAANAPVRKHVGELDWDRTLQCHLIAPIYGGDPTCLIRS